MRCCPRRLDQHWGGVLSSSVHRSNPTMFECDGCHDSWFFSSFHAPPAAASLETALRIALRILLFEISPMSAHRADRPQDGLDSEDPLSSSESSMAAAS